MLICADLLCAALLLLGVGWAVGYRGDLWHAAVVLLGVAWAARYHADLWHAAVVLLGVGWTAGYRGDDHLFSHQGGRPDSKCRIQVSVWGGGARGRAVCVCLVMVMGAGVVEERTVGVKGGGVEVDGQCEGLWCRRGLW